MGKKLVQLESNHADGSIRKYRCEGIEGKIKSACPIGDPILITMDPSKYSGGMEEKEFITKLIEENAFRYANAYIMGEYAQIKNETTIQKDFHDNSGSIKINRAFVPVQYYKILSK